MVRIRPCLGTEEQRRRSLRNYVLVVAVKKRDEASRDVEPQSSELCTVRPVRGGAIRKVVNSRAVMMQPRGLNAPRAVPHEPHENLWGGAGSAGFKGAVNTDKAVRPASEHGATCRESKGC